MKFAIDRFSVGQEAEVSAEDFENLNYIPGRRERFFLPRMRRGCFLQKSGKYQLSIGFPALGTDMLGKAADANYQVKITDGFLMKKTEGKKCGAETAYRQTEAIMPLQKII